jgi:hypothetical protein
MALLDTLAVHTLWVGETEKAFFEVTTRRMSAKALTQSDVPTYSFSFQNAKAMFMRP